MNDEFSMQIKASSGVKQGVGTNTFHPMLLLGNIIAKTSNNFHADNNYVYLWG